MVNKIADAITDRYLEPLLEFKETMQKLTSEAANE